MSITAELARAESENKEFAHVLVVDVKGAASREPGAEMIVYSDGTTSGTVGGGIVELNAKSDALQSLTDGIPMLREYKIADEDRICGVVSCFIRPRVAAKKLFLFGAGHVAQEIVPIAKAVGFYVTVIDPREELSKTEKIRLADRVIVDEYDVFDDTELDEKSYVFVGTFDHAIDGRVLGKALRSNALYVGMLGGKPKIEKIFANLHAEGISEEILSKAHTPIGLDIGGREPSEIAVSVVAEMIAVGNGRSGGFSRIQ